MIKLVLSRERVDSVHEWLTGRQAHKYKGPRHSTALQPSSSRQNALRLWPSTTWWQTQKYLPRNKSRGAHLPIATRCWAHCLPRKHHVCASRTCATMWNSGLVIRGITKDFRISLTICWEAYAWPQCIYKPRWPSTTQWTWSLGRQRIREMNWSPCLSLQCTGVVWLAMQPCSRCKWCVTWHALTSTWASTLWFKLLPYQTPFCLLVMLPVRFAGCIASCWGACSSVVEWSRGVCEACGGDSTAPSRALWNFKEMGVIRTDTPHLVRKTGQTHTLVHAAAASLSWEGLVSSFSGT